MRIGSIAGTSIHAETSFFILAGFFVVMDMEQGAPVHIALLWVPLLLLSVLVHELGHAGTLGLLGFGPSHIALAGFGGVTINRRRSRPWQDILVSLAGPACSFLIAGAAWLALLYIPYTRRDPLLWAFLPLLMQANIFWGIFNLIPIYPLDGGHALHDLSRYAAGERATLKFSAWSSIVLAGLIVMAGLLLRQFFVVIIAAMLLHQNWQRLHILPPRPPDAPPES